MDVKILEDAEGGTAILTTNSPASSYGIPVLQITAEDVDGDFGPSDMIGDMDDAYCASERIPEDIRAHYAAALFLEFWFEDNKDPNYRPPSWCLAKSP